MKTKGLDIIRLVMSVLAIIWAIVLGVFILRYFYTLTKGDDISNIFLIFLLPILLIMGVLLIINMIMGITGVCKFIRNKNITLIERNIKTGHIVVKIIVSIIGLSLPLLIAYICDIVERNKKQKLLTK